MNVIDKILEEWSFRCHDGIVDLNDPIKMSILNEIIGFDLDEAKSGMEKWKKYCLNLCLVYQKKMEYISFII
jgi:hypothetical protein